MHEETVGSKVVKWVLIGVSVLFLVLLLLRPLVTVISEALRDGWKTYQAAVTDKYTVKAILLTLEATACAVGINTIFGVFAALAVTKYHFRGKKVLTTLIDVPVTVSPIIAGLIFLLTFGRQSVLYPLMQDLGIKVVQREPWVSSVQFPSSPDTCVVRPIHCPCTWRSCSMNSSMCRHLQFRPFWFSWQL